MGGGVDDLGQPMVRANLDLKHGASKRPVCRFTKRRSARLLVKRRFVARKMMERSRDGEDTTLTYQ